MIERVKLHGRAKRFIRAVTPPILLAAAKKALVRLGLWSPAVAVEVRKPHVSLGGDPSTADVALPADAVEVPVPPPSVEGDASPAEMAAPSAEPPEWEYVPEGWARPAKGWDAGAVAEAYLDKWPEWLEALRGAAPLGVYHEAPSGVPLPRDDIAAHNMLVSFAYVLARAAHGRDKIKVLDWGGGLGHYAVVARAVLPEVGLDWHCREVASVARAGARVHPEVTFHADDDCLDTTYDLVFASGSLQYEEAWRVLLGRLAAATIGFLLITRLPVSLSAPSFVVLQRAYAYGYATEYLGWVISRPELLAAASAARLELERELVVHAWLPPIGAPEEPIGHRGFVFRPVRLHDRPSSPPPDACRSRSSCVRDLECRWAR